MVKFPYLKLVYRAHALQRMFERKISENDVQFVLKNGKTIETYSTDKPYPSCLILGWCERRPVHIVAADNQDALETVIVTVYEPDLKVWENDFKTRRSS